MPRQPKTPASKGGSKFQDWRSWLRIRSPDGSAGRNGKDTAKKSPESFQVVGHSDSENAKWIVRQWRGLCREQTIYLAVTHLRPGVDKSGKRLEPYTEFEGCSHEVWIQSQLPSMGQRWRYLFRGQFNFGAGFNRYPSTKELDRCALQVCDTIGEFIDGDNPLRAEGFTYRDSDRHDFWTKFIAIAIQKHTITQIHSQL